MGNIILYRAKPNEARRGYLVDWDHSWLTDSPNPHANYWRSVSEYNMCDMTCTDVLLGYVAILVLRTT